MGMKVRNTAFILLIVFVFFASSMLYAARTELISRSPGGAVGDGDSQKPSISDNGRYIVYQSRATNLVTDKTTSRSDIFLYDRNTKMTTRINLAYDGSEANSSSYNPQISADGTVIAFSSTSSNLIDDDTEGLEDIFVYDRSDGTITRVSVNSDDEAGDDDSTYPDISDDGRYIVFQSSSSNLDDEDDNGRINIFRHDRQTGKTIRVNYDFLGDISDHDCTYPVISDNGRYVAFQTYSALTPCDDNNDSDIFLRDINEKTTTLTSVTTYGCVANNNSYHPSMSGEARYIAFSTYSTDLEIEDDTNHQQDVYIRDRQEMTTERVSISTNGEEGDGRSVGYGGNISSDGRYVVFSTNSSNLIDNDGNGGYDVYARDRTTQMTTREGVGHYWQQGTGDPPANTTVISANGKYIVFDSSSSGIVSGDNNGDWDIFIRDYLWSGPLITSINPRWGLINGGTLLTITGSNFDQNAAVTIDGVSALNINVNATGDRILCITPPHSVGKVEIQVTNNDGTSWLFPIGYGFSGFIYRTSFQPHLSVLLLK